jgi:hypothetical protein
MAAASSMTDHSACELGHQGRRRRKEVAELMHGLIMSMFINEHLTQMRADSEIARHAATARQLRQAKRKAARKPAPDPEPYLGFLPRLIGYPYSR